MTEARKGKRARRSASEWRSLLAEFGRSGLQIEAFCRRKAISVGSFYRWRRQLEDVSDAEQDRRAASDAAFVDLGTLNVASAAQPRLELKLDLGGGLVLHLVRH